MLVKHYDPPKLWELQIHITFPPTNLDLAKGEDNPFLWKWAILRVKRCKLFVEMLSDWWLQQITIAPKKNHWLTTMVI